MELSTLLPFVGVLITLGMWMTDRFGWFTSLRKKPMKMTGTWHGWSVYRPTTLANPSSHQDPEHFFKVRLSLVQRFNRLTLEETVEEIFRRDGSKILGVAARSFHGGGKMLNGVHLALTFDEQEGLTCGTMFLTMNTWGTELSGAMLVRNVDGRPVLAELHLWRESKPALLLTDMLEAENRMLPLSRSDNSVLLPTMGGSHTVSAEAK